MSDNSKIEWTDATWNPVTGCTKVSEGCRNCYALKFAERWRGTPGHYFENGFDITLRPDKLDQPLKWKKPRRIFVNSMSDLFHPDVPFDFIDQVFAVMALCPQHTFQILTKRPERMLEYFQHRFRSLKVQLASHRFYIPEEGEFTFDWPLSNVWLGVSVENQRAADERIPLLLQTPATVRFLSMEPLLGPVNLQRFEHDGMYMEPLTGYWHSPLLSQGKETSRKINWVVVGSESGPNRRPCDLELVRSIRDQCVAADIPFFLKQLYIDGRKVSLPEIDGRVWDEFPAQ